MAIAATHVTTFCMFRLAQCKAPIHMKLSIYLIRPDETDLECIVQSKYLDDDGGYVQLTPTASLPYECRAFVQSNKAKAPRWLPFLATHFDTAPLNLLNRSNSFVLVLKAANRIFAVTFGHGFQAINRAKIEPRFGLMVAASALNPEQIRTLETNLIDTVTRNKRTHVSTGSRVDEFDLNPHVDWIRKLSGKPTSEDLAKFVSGSDSVCIGVDCDLSSVGAKCSELLDAYESDAYRDAFSYLDHLRPLGKHEPEVEGLEALLSSQISDRAHDRISIAFPELPDEELLEHYKVSSNGHSVELEELTLDCIYQFIAEVGIDSDPGHIFVVGIGDNGEPVTKRRNLREYIVCEIDRDDDTYIFCLGHWFRAQRAFVQQIRDEVASIADCTNELELLPIRNGESETAYNVRLADDKEWRVMDKDNFYVANTYDKVEVCDLLTEEWNLVCVKKMNKSSTLSHLFAQGSVSATLVREFEEYRGVLNEAAVDQWPGLAQLTADNLGKATVVYAIATRKAGSLAECMFFFSLVNLLSHVRAIRRVGCAVALCKISYEEHAPRPRRATRRRRTHPQSEASAETN